MAVSLHNQKMRLEQLKRYEGSMLDITSTAPRDPEKTKFRFKDEYIFLTVCASDDVKEAERLLNEGGVDINTANVDGLTALHQACLNQKMDIVKLLVEHSADVNICDNDGWTPLHAACSTDNIEIAGYLVNNGSELAAVSFEGELPIDVTEDETLVHFLSDAMAKLGIDSETAKSQEEKTIKEDAEFWLKTGTYDNKNVHPLSGASPLHVAAARGYVDVIQILLKAGANINAQDCDGWTPMHAAAHWGQGEACQLLVNNLCDLSIPNSLGLLAQDVADPELGNLIDELKEKQVELYTDLDLRRRSFTSRRSRSSVSRMSFDQKQIMVQKSRGEERTVMEMMLAKRNSHSDLEDDDSNVFDDDEGKEEEMAVGVKRDAEKNGTVQNDMNIEHVESENSTGIEVELLKEKSIPCEPDEEENIGETIQKMNVLEGSTKPEEKKIETENLSTKSLAEISQHQNQISTSETARRELENKDRSSAVSSETKPQGVSFDATLQPVMPMSGSFLSSATTAALRALANSHMWSMDDPRKDEEKENARRSRAIQLRKEKLEKRRSTQGVLKEDVSRAGASVQATKGIIEEEFPENQMSSEVDNKNETLYRRNAPQEATIPFEDNENTEPTALARARRKGRLSARPVRQENFEEMNSEKENQGISVDDGTEAKSNERSEIANEVQLDRLSSHENISVNSSLPLSTLQLPTLTTDIQLHSCLENDSIDYKKLYEKEHSLNEALLLQNKCLQKQINDTTLQMEQCQEVCRSVTKEKQELEIRISKFETEFQNVEELKSNNQRLKLDNAALVRVIGHLSKQTNP